MGGDHDYSNDGGRRFFVIIMEQNIIWLAINFIKMMNMMNSQQN